MNAKQVSLELQFISNSKLPSEDLELRLAAIPMVDLWKWTLSETMEVERQLKAAKKNISSRKTAEYRLVGKGK